MKKIAIITDSESGISQEEAAELGIYVQAMPFMIDGKTYYEGINLSQPEFYEMLLSDADISTSQPSPEAVTKMWDDLLKDNDEIVDIPMSSGLSNTCATALMLAEDYGGRVQIVNNHRISVPQYQSVLDAIHLRDAGHSAVEIKDILAEKVEDNTSYIMVDTLKYLRKGGRLTPAVAALGTFLRVKPVLQIQGEKLDTYSMARTITQARSTMVTALKRDIQERFGGLEGKRVHLEIAHTQNDEQVEILKKEIWAALPEYADAEIVAAPLSLSIACHIGPGALACGCTRIIDIK